MKIKNRLLIAVIFIFTLSQNIFGQGGKKITLTPAELQKETSLKTEADPLAQLSAAQKNAAREKAQVVAVYLTKAILHKKDPATYPMDENGVMEKRSLDAIKGFSPALLSKAYSSILSTLSNAAKMENVYGKFRTVNYKIQEIASQLKKAGMQFTAVSDRTKIVIAEDNKLRFKIQRLRCLDETDPETNDDDMLIGGILIGNTGRTHAGNTLVSCQFNDGDVCDHGEFNFGGLGLNMGTFPKSFYCVIVLIEVDSDQQESAVQIHMAIESIASMLGDQGIETSELAAAAKYTLESFLPILSNDVFFPAEIVRLNMVNGNSLGSDNRSDNLRTPNIAGDGGSYRVGYFWQKIN